MKLIRVRQFLLVGTGNSISAVQIRELQNDPSVKGLHCLSKYRNYQWICPEAFFLTGKQCRPLIRCRSTQCHCSFTVQDFVLQTYIKQNKTDTPKFKIVLSKGILLTFANGVDRSECQVRSGSPMFVSRLGTFGVGKQCKPRSAVADLVWHLIRVVTVCLIYRNFCIAYNK